MNRRKAFVSILDDDVDIDDEDIDKITSYCERCKSFGFNHLLGPRIYPKDEPIPYDSNKWLQCYNCGTIVPKVHAKHENEIEGVKSVPDNIHDASKVVVLSSKGGPSHRRSRAIIDQIKKTRPGANRQNNYTDVDIDVRSHLSSGKKLISYCSTNDEFQG